MQDSPQQLQAHTSAKGTSLSQEILKSSEIESHGLGPWPLSLVDLRIKHYGQEKGIDHMV